MDLTCPQCGQLDQVKAVSSVISGGVSSGAYAGPSVGVAQSLGKHGRTSIATGYTTLSGESQTLLSERLVPPAQPVAASSLLWIVGWIIAMILGVPGLCLFAAGASIGKTEGVLTLLLGLALLGCAAVAPIVTAAISVQRDKKEKDRVRKERPRWEKAMDRWSKLFHCARCDGVFDPDERMFISTGLMMHYLYH